MQRNGFSDAEIQAYENDLRQNSAASTARALKEHFILERIAEDQEIDADADDYQAEIALIAAQSGESVRRVRARLEKGGMMDALRNQIIERKVIDLVLSHAKFKDVPYKPEGTETEAIDQSAGGEETESEIPEAKHPAEAEPLRTSKDTRRIRTRRAGPWTIGEDHESTTAARCLHGTQDLDCPIAERRIDWLVTTVATTDRNRRICPQACTIAGRRRDLEKESPWPIATINASGK